jgi:hypothetical protein
MEISAARFERQTPLCYYLVVERNGLDIELGAVSKRRFGCMLKLHLGSVSYWLFPVVDLKP